MSLLENLRAKLTEARKAGQTMEMSLLQVVLGEASTAEARSGKKPTDEEMEKIIRKTAAGITETLDVLRQRNMTAGPDFAKLTAEGAYLATLLPTTLSVEEIKANLAEVADAVKAAKNDGQATGLAMKHLKGKNLKVLGEDVSAAIRDLRK